MKKCPAGETIQIYMFNPTLIFLNMNDKYMNKDIGKKRKSEISIA